MKLERFKEKDKKKIGIILFTLTCILLITGVILYRTFAVFETNDIFNIINGSVEDVGDIYFAFYKDDVIQKEMPQKESGYVFNSEKSYCGVLGEKDSSIQLWFDRDDWAVTIDGIATSRTKCNLYFDKGENFIDKIKSLPRVSSGDGLYEVSHQDAAITYTTDATVIQNLKLTELRYAGAQPNNYVWFNRELWRVIGLVNTPEGQRIKLVRKDSIGRYSWDSSDASINSGGGINEWSQADIMYLLTDFYYHSLSNQLCFIGVNNQTAPCDFSKIGLKFSHSFIDTVTWNTGFDDGSMHTNLTKNYYELERGNSVLSQKCIESSNCNDKIVRNLSFKNRIGLIYLSDYGYATTGLNRDGCLSEPLYEWGKDRNPENTECTTQNWLYTSTYRWTMTPSYVGTFGLGVQSIYSVGRTESNSASSTFDIFPVLYLKPDVLVLSNSLGTESSPFRIG